jgi:mono/diheme cytochrome c family protein
VKFAVAMMLLVACGRGDAETQRQIEETVERHDAGTEGRNNNPERDAPGVVERQIMAALEAFSSAEGVAAVYGPDRTDTILDPPFGKVALRLNFQSANEPLPGGGLIVYTPSPDVTTLWAMESLTEGQTLPVGDALESSTLFLAPGESQLITVAYKNPTDQDVAFLVLAPTGSPGELAPMIWRVCLCGMNFPYQVPARGAWYRVIHMEAKPEFPVGAKVDVTWTILTGTAEIPIAFSSGGGPGKSLSARNGCTACHSDDGSARIGPTWKGLFGKRNALADGTTVTVDEAYLREAILDPNASVVSGYTRDIMPTYFRQKISDDQIEAIIEYIKSLK